MKTIRILFSATFIILIFHMSFGTFTRSSGSGLSMTQWDLFDVSLYPTEKSVRESYIKYKNIPQFTVQNYWMEFDDFRSIFFVEWFHRLCGKIIGLLCLIIFLISLFPRLQVPFFLRIYLFFMLLLVCFQGYLGWRMVYTGVTCDYAFDKLCTSVSPSSFLNHSVMSYIILIFFSLLLFSIHKSDALSKKRKGSFYIFIIYFVLCFLLLLQIFFGTKLVSMSLATSYQDIIPAMHNLFFVFQKSGFQDFLSELRGDEYLIYKHMINGLCIIFLSCIGAFIANFSRMSIFNIHTSLVILLVLQIFLGYYIAYIHKIWYTQTLHQFVSTLLLVFSLRCTYDAFVSFTIRD